MGEAIAREKQIKRWNRTKKITLIEKENPTWEDLAAEWGKPIELYDWSKEQNQHEEQADLSTPLRSR